MQIEITEEKILTAYYLLAGFIIGYCLYECFRMYITRFYEIHTKVSYLVYLEKMRMQEKAVSEETAKSDTEKK